MHSLRSANPISLNSHDYPKCRGRIDAAHRRGQIYRAHRDYHKSGPYDVIRPTASVLYHLRNRAHASLRTPV